jgi:type II secretory pathway pseudopilin PulG
MTTSTEPIALTPEPPIRERHRARYPTILLAVVIVAGIIGALVAVNSAASSRATQLSRQITQLRHQLATDQHNLKAANAEITGLAKATGKLALQVAGLNVPTDPLANYDEVCTIYAPSALNITSNWYLPCTTNAETIPQPG